MRPRHGSERQQATRTRESEKVSQSSLTGCDTETLRAEPHSRASRRHWLPRIASHCIGFGIPLARRQCRAPQQSAAEPPALPVREVNTLTRLLRFSDCVTCADSCVDHSSFTFHLLSVCQSVPNWSPPFAFPSSQSLRLASSFLHATRPSREHSSPGNEVHQKSNCCAYLFTLCAPSVLFRATAVRGRTTTVTIAKRTRGRNLNTARI